MKSLVIFVFAQATDGASEKDRNIRELTLHEDVRFRGRSSEVELSFEYKEGGEIGQSAINHSALAQSREFPSFQFVKGLSFPLLDFPNFFNFL